MDQQNRPNPVSKAAEHSNLPRTKGRMRVTEPHDPIPSGKELDVEPKHHFNAVDAPDHDPNRLVHKNATELGIEPHELEKMQKKDREKVVLYAHDTQGGMDWAGTATQANKKMSSAHHHYGEVPSGKTHYHKK